MIGKTVNQSRKASSCSALVKKFCLQNFPSFYPNKSLQGYSSFGGPNFPNANDEEKYNRVMCSYTKQSQFQVSIKHRGNAYFTYRVSIDLSLYKTKDINKRDKTATNIAVHD